MSDQMPQYETPDPGTARKKRTKIILMIIAAILIPSCLMCGWKLYGLLQPGEPLPAAAFIDDDTTGIVVLRADGSDPNVRSILAYGAGLALEQNVEPDYEALLKFLASEDSEDIPAVTLVVSYKGRTPDELRSFNVLSLRQLLGVYRWVGSRMFDALAESGSAGTHENARIVSIKKVMETLRQQAKEKAGQIPSIPWMEEYHCTLFESCLIAGKTPEDVQAGVAALLAPEPAAESERPFMEVYRHADTSALCFGALSNENDLLLSALFPDADQREDAREFVEPILTFDPQQVRNIAFSADLVSDDEAVVKLWLECANNDIAKQLEAAVRAFVNSHGATTEDIPFELVIDEAATKTEGTVHEAVINVSGIKAWIKQCVSQLAQKRQEQRELEGAKPGAKEAAPGPGVPQTDPVEEPATAPE